MNIIVVPVSPVMNEVSPSESRPGESGPQEVIQQYSI